MTNKRFALSWPESTIEQLKQRHADTYPTHRLSFSAWLLSRVQISFTVPDS